MERVTGFEPAQDVGLESTALPLSYTRFGFFLSIIEVLNPDTFNSFTTLASWQYFESVLASWRAAVAEGAVMCIRTFMLKVT